MARIKKIFVEYGLDFDNNKYGLGRSVEIEYTNGTELRTHEKIDIDNIAGHYIRIWLGKHVMIIDSGRPHISFCKKNRRNFKIVYGIAGQNAQ